MDAPRHPKEYLTIDEFSALTGRSVSSLRRDVRKGRLEAFQPAGVGGKLLFARQALEKCRVAAGATLPPPQSASTRLSGRQPGWMKSPPTNTASP